MFCADAYRACSSRVQILPDATFCVVREGRRCEKNREGAGRRGRAGFHIPVPTPLLMPFQGLSQTRGRYLVTDRVTTVRCHFGGWASDSSCQARERQHTYPCAECSTARSRRCASCARDTNRLRRSSRRGCSRVRSPPSQSSRRSGATYSRDCRRSSTRVRRRVSCANRCHRPAVQGAQHQVALAADGPTGTRVPRIPRSTRHTQYTRTGP